MATMSALLYFREAEGEQKAQQVFNSLLDMAQLGETGSDMAVGRSVYTFTDPFFYFKAVYGNGMIFLEELRTTMGDDAFFAFIQAYYEMFKYDVATGAEFQALAQSSSGQDLSELFEKWLR
jgi:aminopeptidase N